MLVAGAEPGKLIEQPNAVCRLAGIERLIPAEGEVLHAVRSVIEVRVHEHSPTRQAQIRMAVVARGAGTECRLLEDPEAEVAVVTCLNPRIPRGACAARRGQR